MRIECFFQIDLIGEALREETMKGGAVVHLIDNGFLVVPPGFKKIPEVENPDRSAFDCRILSQWNAI